MIKLYVFYFIFGLYMLFNSYTIWYFSGMFSSSGREVDITTYAAVFSSLILFLGCPGLLLYRIKSAIIVGSIALIAVFPFGIHWLIYRIQMEAPITKGTFNQVALLATLMYVAGLLYSIFLLIYSKKQLSMFNLKKWLKVFLAVLPAFLLVVFIILGLINP
jgi:hypothetical protein